MDLNSYMPISQKTRDALQMISYNTTQMRACTDCQRVAFFRGAEICGVFH